VIFNAHILTHDTPAQEDTGISAFLYFGLIIALLFFGLGHIDTVTGATAGGAPEKSLPALSEALSPLTKASLAVPEAVPITVLETLTPRMHAALDHVSRRYRVSPEALLPVFRTVQASGRERQLDPLLIIAIIGIESSFNPISESTMGALGLMQVMPRFHLDKLPAGAEKTLFLDPVINIQVGTHVLQESIQRNGGLIAGLQQFAGAINDEQQTYATKVLAEKERLEQAARRSGGNSLYLANVTQ
jgi:hypothetical protein